jgi:hypothetical protein
MFAVWAATRQGKPAFCRGLKCGQVHGGSDLAGGGLFGLGAALFCVVAIGCHSGTTSVPEKQPASIVDSTASTPAAQPSQRSTAVDADSNASTIQLSESLMRQGLVVKANPRTGAIESVDCGQVVVTDSLAAQLSALGDLTQIVIRKSAISAANWGQLASKWTKLQHLDLRGCHLQAEVVLGLRQLGGTLKSLRLGGQEAQVQLDAASWECLGQFTSLKVLSAEKVDFVDLTKLDRSAALSELYLTQSTINDDQVDSWQSLTGLKKIRLAGTSIGSATVRAVAQLPQLEDLDISQCPGVDDRCVAELKPLRKSLKRLNLYRTNLTDTGAAVLSVLTGLQWLNLDDTKIGDSGLESLKDLSSLTFLHLGLTAVTDAGITQLAKLKMLRSLIVTRTKVTAAGVEALRSANPNVDIQLEYVAGQ